MPADMLDDLIERYRGRVFGKYRGEVTGNDDATKRGRLKVRCEPVLGSLEVWAMPCVPYAGPSVGFYSLPEAGAGVWVEFEGGDPSFPIWTGCYWRDNELPDPGGAAVKIWKTEKVTIRADDDNDELKIVNTQESTLIVKDSVKAEVGEAAHTVASTGVTSEIAAGKVEVTATSVSVNSGAWEVM